METAGNPEKAAAGIPEAEESESESEMDGEFTAGCGIDFPCTSFVPVDCQSRARDHFPRPVRALQFLHFHSLELIEADSSSRQD